MHKRARNARANGKRPSHGFRATTLESHGGDIKIRGTIVQVFEKYQALARDAMALGDRVGAENYLQHAEHYFRLMSADRQFYRASLPTGSGATDGAEGFMEAESLSKSESTAQEGAGSEPASQ